MRSLAKVTFLILTIIYLSKEGKIWQETQKLQAIKTKPCSAGAYTDCYSKQVIPQPALRAGALLNVTKLPGTNTQVTSDGVTTLYVDFVIQRLENIHPEQNTLKIMGFPRMWWVDERLAWTPADQANMTETHYDSDKVWVPDVIPVLGTGQTLVQTWARWKDVVWTRYDGLCRWSPKGTFEIITNLDLTKSPDAKQTVDIVWESWMYTEDQLQLRTRFANVDHKNLFHNAGWNYEGSRAWLSNCTEQNSVSCFPSLNFEISFKRMVNEDRKQVATIKSQLLSVAGTNGLLAVILIVVFFDSLIYFLIRFCERCKKHIKN